MSKQETWQEAIKKLDRAEHALRELDRSNGLAYSLDDETRRSFLEHQCESSHSSPERAVIKAMAQQTLYQALDSLSPLQRQRIYRHFWEQESFSEIARQEGVDESAVRHCIQRGLLQLKKKLKGTGIAANDFAVHTPIRYVKHRRPKKPTADRQKTTPSLINLDEGGAVDGKQGSICRGN